MHPGKWGRPEMKGRYTAAMASMLLLGFSSPSSAEYLIYLKGGHYLVADDCAFSSRQEIGKDPGTEEKVVLVEDCTTGKPEGQIFWSTIDGKFGEVNAEDVYAIFGSKTLAPIKPPRAAMPLEDYLITLRGESFLNVKTYEEKDNSLYGFKRDDLSRINRRAVTEIAREGEAKSRSGEGLCPGEPAEFDVSGTELVGNRLVGDIRNLSREMCMPVTIEVHVREKGRLKGKFPVTELNVIPPGDSITFDVPVRADLLKYVEGLTNPEAGIRLCYKKVLSQSECVRRTGQPIAGQPAAGQSAK